MPELPDLTMYLEALERVAVGRDLERVRLADAFIVRTADPPLGDLQGRRLLEVRRGDGETAQAEEPSLTSPDTKVVITMSPHHSI